MAGMAQRQAKKGRRGDRNGGVRTNKTSPSSGDNLAQLLKSPAEGGVYSNPSLAHTLVSLIGCVVEVQLVNGTTYEGILRAISPNMDISLNVAHVKGQEATVDSVYNRREVAFAEVVTFSAKTGTNPQINIFKTDTEISGHTNGPQSRELQPFTDFTEEEGGGTADMMEGEDESDGWTAEEMFAVNKDKFKVSSTYDEELPQYTTQLVREGEGYRQRELEAIQLAKEIESRSVLSRHGVDDVGTEEERWSSVQRDKDRLCGGDSAPTQVIPNGTHTLTTSHVTPHIQAPPTIATPTAAAAAPLAPPTSLSSSSSSSSLVTPSPQTNSTCSIADSETTPTAPPNMSQLPSNKQIIISSDNTQSSDDVIDTNEGKSLEIETETTHSSANVVVSPTSLEDAPLAEEVANPSEEVTQSSLPLQSPVGQDNDEEEEEEKEEEEKEEEEEEEEESEEIKEGTPETASGSEKVAETEQAIKNFKLDPTAKEFVVPTSFLSSPSSIPTTSSTSSSSTISSSTSSSSSSTSSAVAGSVSSAGTPSTAHTHTRTHPHTPRGGGGGGGGGTRYSSNNSSWMRPLAASFAAQDLHTAVSSSYVLSQQPVSSMAGLLRPGLPGFSQYPVPPAPLVGMPPIIANPHSQMLGAGTQQQFPIVPQPQLFPAHAQHIYTTPQGIMMPAATQQGPNSLFMGGVPLSPMHPHQQQMVAAAAAVAGMPQVTPAAVAGAVGPPSIAGTTAAASGLQRAYQMPGGGGK